MTEIKQKPLSKEEKAIVELFKEVMRRVKEELEKEGEE